MDANGAVVGERQFFAAEGGQFAQRMPVARATSTSRCTSLHRQKGNSAHFAVLEEADLPAQVAVHVGQAGQRGGIVRSQPEPLVAVHQVREQQAMPDPLLLPVEGRSRRSTIQSSMSRG